MKQNIKRSGALLAVFTVSILLLASCAAPATTVPATLAPATTTPIETTPPATAAPTETAPPATASPAETATPAPTATAVATTAPEGKVFTLAELAKYDGKNGNPAYIAVGGVVYDVTDVREWRNGGHKGFQAGQDLTDAFKNQSPHGASILKGLPVVGTLAKQ